MRLYYLYTVNPGLSPAYQVITLQSTRGKPGESRESFGRSPCDMKIISVGHYRQIQGSKHYHGLAIALPQASLAAICTACMYNTWIVTLEHPPSLPELQTWRLPAYHVSPPGPLRGIFNFNVSEVLIVFFSHNPLFKATPLVHMTPNASQCTPTPSSTTCQHPVFHSFTWAPGTFDSLS